MNDVQSPHKFEMDILLQAIDLLSCPTPEPCWLHQKRALEGAIPEPSFSLQKQRIPLGDITNLHRKLGAEIDFQKEVITFNMKWYEEDKLFIEQTLDECNKFGCVGTCKM